MAQTAEKKPQDPPPTYVRQVGEGFDLPREEVMKNVVRYEDLQLDPNSFIDKETGKPLPIKYVISPDNKAGPAGITEPHKFHMCFIESKVGNSPVTHFHSYREIFMPIRGRYAIYFNEDSSERVELGPLDCFSVPPGLWRRVEQIPDGDNKMNGMVMVIFDDVEDPHAGIFVPQSVVDADAAQAEKGSSS